MQQPTPTICSRLKVLSVLADATELSAFDRRYSSVKMLAEYLDDALSSQQRQHMLLLEHNLLSQLLAAAAKALQLMGQEPGFAEATDDALDSIFSLLLSTSEWITCTQQAVGSAAGMGAIYGEWWRRGASCRGDHCIHLHMHLRIPHSCKCVYICSYP